MKCYSYCEFVLKFKGPLTSFVRLRSHLSLKTERELDSLLENLSCLTTNNNKKNPNSSDVCVCGVCVRSLCLCGFSPTSSSLLPPPNVC